MQPLIAPEEHSSKFLSAGSKYLSSSSSTSTSASFEGQEYILNDSDANNSTQSVRLWWMYEKESDIGRLISGLDTRFVKIYQFHRLLETFVPQLYSSLSLTLSL